MTKKLEVGIIGGGPAGLSTGSKLAREGAHVKVYEEHPRIGKPMHCAGVISPSTFSLIKVSQQVVKNHLYGVRVGVPDRIDVTYQAESRRAIVIDRERLDVELAERLVSVGGELLLSHRASLEMSGEKIYLRSEGERERFDYVVDAGGVKSYLSRVGINGDVLPAAQMDIITPDCDQRIVEMWVDKARNKDFFFWCVPLEEDLVRVGTASKTEPEAALNSFAVWRFSKVEAVKKLYGQIVFSGYTEKLVEGKVLYVGDAAGQTKPTTGGGLRYGLSGAEEAARAIIHNFREEEPLNIYEERWVERWRREVQIQRLVRKIFLRLDEKKLVRLLETVRDDDLLPILVDRGDMDEHSSLLSLLSKRRIHRLGIGAIRALISEMISPRR
ncbi:MAG: NAD(P)-binding protein [Nitrososphaeria archaeon]|nr:NAD(P)-binding protein [Nitrososphaeria archaeon]NIN53295.1 NAD(P)-binding protein [Nitrososphaeria archaeon]NIQ33748.1 NAD(P)-binding protein [Nitrososphaeria archaeon]